MLSPKSASQSSAAPNYLPLPHEIFLVLLVASANIQQLNEYFDPALPITSKAPIQAPILAMRALAGHTHLTL
jgi:hypothetical protein